MREARFPCYSVHFLPLFGAGTPEANRPHGLFRRVALVVDADPARKKREPKARRLACWPYQLGVDVAAYEYYPESGVVSNLRDMLQSHPMVQLYVGKKTLEYDLAHTNWAHPLLVTDVCTHSEELRALAQPPFGAGTQLAEKLSDGDDPLEAIIGLLSAAEDQNAARFATCYLLCAEGGKGAHAFALEQALRANHSLPPESRAPFQVPDHLRDAIRWACRKPLAGTPA